MTKTKRVTIRKHKRRGKIIKPFKRKKRPTGRGPFKTTKFKARKVRRDRSGMFTRRRKK